MAILDQPQVQAEALFGVPYVYKLLGENEAGIKTLRKFKLCLFGGSAMPTELGDRLVEAGVRLAGHYVCLTPSLLRVRMLMVLFYRVQPRSDSS